MNRRTFLRNSALLASAPLFGSSAMMQQTVERKRTEKLIRITGVDANFEREPLIRPFGFKGGYMREIWQTAAWMQSENRTSKVGICTQNVLWSDAQVFAAHSESAGNALMFAMTERALQIIKGQTFRNPVELLDQIEEEVYQYGIKITGNPNLRKTFALNALVGIDNAAWLLYCAENGIKTFDEMVPEVYRPALSHRHDKVASIPLMAYNIPIGEIEQAVADGYFFMKIKIGQPGTQEEMVRKDMERLTAIHKAIGNARTPYTDNGKLPYYFDANGRYEKKEYMHRFLDHARKIGAFDQIAIIEEPFAEEMEVDVRDLGVRIVSDETAHTDKDAIARIEMGYGAIALKAIAKTLSMSMKVAKAAHERNVPCFCADLTVNPILVEWNKNVAARLGSFPGIKGGLGLCESNGHQNYSNWQTMVGYNPTGSEPWAKTEQGVFNLSPDYYSRSGGIFEQSEHYTQWFKPNE